MPAAEMESGACSSLGTPHGQPHTTNEACGIELSGLNYSYQQDCPAFIKNCQLQLPKGSRCLLVGANGAGKYMVDKQMVQVLGRPPFHDMALTCSGQLSYLGTSWRKDVACAGYGVPLQGDISAGKMLFGIEGVDPARRQVELRAGQLQVAEFRAQLIQLLDIDVYQRLNTMSDGQRRRVQIAMGLLKPYDVLLLDEITVDLDVVGRLQLLEFFRAECEERGATILYATHIFDGLEGWITHVAYLEEGQIVKGGPCSAIPDLAEAGQAGKKLLHVVEEWLRTERDARHVKDQAKSSLPISETVIPSRTPYMPSKHLSHFR